ncbi:hypothetical protein G3496_10590 [Shewanella baltica]|uniref:hypothetical protein n=1 Tax=Shewanella baltica TaxID=62322 RepID=UPI00217D0386|nr:hypothetical protein [Shewanella baltica]MCS6135378.1 hypothetical protein [Shewanella baltica]
MHKLDKPEWKVGRPEYFLTIDSDNREFAMFLAYLLSVFSTEKIMSWNTLIGISDGDAIEGFPYRRMALGMPLYLNWEPYKLEPDNELPINFGMAFLISNSDFELAKDRGFSFLTDKLDEDQDYWWKIKRT